MSSNGKTHRSGGAARVAILRRAASSTCDAKARRGSIIDAMRFDSEENVPSTATPEDDNVDIERIAMRLDGFEMYAFLASLVAGFSFGCLNEFDALPHLNKRLPWWMSYPLSVIFAFSLVASIFSGLYATCVFALCSLYSKTALAERKDARMKTFLSDTARFRTRGFRMFIGCLITFALNVLLLALMRLELYAGVPTVILGSYFIYVSLQDMGELLKSASYIFMPHDDDLPGIKPPLAHGISLSGDGDDTPRAPPKPIHSAAGALAVSLAGRVAESASELATAAAASSDSIGDVEGASSSAVPSMDLILGGSSSNLSSLSFSVRKGDTVPKAIARTDTAVEAAGRRAEAAEQLAEQSRALAAMQAEQVRVLRGEVTSLREQLVASERRMQLAIAHAALASPETPPRADGERAQGRVAPRTNHSDSSSVGMRDKPPAANEKEGGACRQRAKSTSGSTAPSA